MESEKLPGSAEPLAGKCGARLKGHDNPNDEQGRFGRYCTQQAGMGTPHLNSGACRYHGGNLPNQIVKGEREKVAMEVTKLRGQLEKPPTMMDPYIELWNLLADVKGWYTVSRGLMAELESIDTTYMDRAGVERSRALVEQFERAMLMMRDTLQMVIKLDLQRRLVELDEMQGRLIAEALLAVIGNAQLGLTDDQVELAQGLLRQNLEPIIPALKAKGMPDLLDVEAAVDEIARL